MVYLDDKLGRGFDRAIYVLGADHHGTRNGTRRSRGCSATTPSASRCCSTSSSTSSRAASGEESKRRGNVVPLDELVDEVGVDAARWYLVSRGHDQTIDIDVDLAAEKTQKNPVYYVQYTRASPASCGTPETPSTVAAPAEVAAEERELIKRLVDFPAGRGRGDGPARATCAPDVHAIRVADDFHRFYPPLLTTLGIPLPPPPPRLSSSPAPST